MAGLGSINALFITQRLLTRSRLHKTGILIPLVSALVANQRFAVAGGAASERAAEPPKVDKIIRDGAPRFPVFVCPAMGIETNPCYNSVAILPPRPPVVSAAEKQSDLMYGVSHVTPQEFCVLPLDI
jgi:hypothetical protein